MQHLPFTSCNADLVSGLISLWLGFRAVHWSFWAPLTSNWCPMCLNTASKCSFLMSAQGFMLFLVPFTLECHLPLSLLSAYLLPMRNHSALFSLTHHSYIGHVWSCILFWFWFLCLFALSQLLATPQFITSDRFGGGGLPLCHISDYRTDGRWSCCDIPLLGCFLKSSWMEEVTGSASYKTRRS